MVPHELDELWDIVSDTPLATGIAVGFELYEAMPCYHNAFVLYQLAYALDDRAEYWDRVRGWLDDARDPLAEPQAYALWVDWFEDADVVEEAWREVVRVPARLEVVRTRRVLCACGPVPWDLKAPLLERVVNEPGWDEWILRALVGSAFEIYGQIDEEHARRLLARIQPPGDARGLVELRERLAPRAPAGTPRSPAPAARRATPRRRA